MAPLRVSTTKSEWLPDDPTAFVPTRLWKLPFITTWDDSRNQNRPTDSAEEAQFRFRTTFPQHVGSSDALSSRSLRRSAAAPGAPGQPHGYPQPRLAVVRTDGPTMHCNRSLGDRKSQAHPAGCPAPPGIHPVERPEELG